MTKNPEAYSDPLANDEATTPLDNMERQLLERLGVGGENIQAAACTMQGYIVTGEKPTEMTMLKNRLRGMNHDSHLQIMAAITEVCSRWEHIPLLKKLNGRAVAHNET